MKEVISSQDSPKVQLDTTLTTRHAEPQKASRQGPTVGVRFFGRVSLTDVSWLLGEMTVQCILLQSNNSEQNQVIFKNPLAAKLPLLRSNYTLDGQITFRKHVWL